MTEPNTATELEIALKERYDKLPKVVQDAIMSADVEKRMRELADTNKLHIDQWQTLENEVMLTLLGVKPIEDLEKNIKKEVGVFDEIAATLAGNISKIVFEPIRQELERQLEHPDAKAAEVSDVEGVRTQILTDSPAPAAQSTPVAAEAAPATTSAAPTVAPATPPAEAPTTKIERAPISAAYHAGETSAARKSVDDDPYREPPA